MREHAVIEELLSARALGGLDPQDEVFLARERASHGVDCEECRRLEDDYAEVAGRLAFSLEPEPVRHGLEDDVVARAMQPRTPAGAVMPTRWRGLAAIAAAVALFAGGWLVRDLTTPGAESNPAGFLADARLVRFQGTGGDLALAYRPGEKGVLLVGLGLQTPPAGKVYEVWMIQGTTPVRTTCFRPAASGDVLRFVDASLASTDSMAVTVEPRSCPSAPTSQPIATAPIAPV